MVKKQRLQHIEYSRCQKGKIAYLGRKEEAENDQKLVCAGWSGSKRIVLWLEG